METDALGHRFRKGAASKTVYAYDVGGKLLGEYDAAGTPQQEYIYLGTTPIAVWTGGKVYALHPDHLGSPRVVTDNAGAVVWNWKGEPFGATAPTGSFALNLRHPGQYYDVETGWFFNNARYYDSALGQYISSDPIGLDGGINTYAYVEGNPMANSDPSCLAPGLPSSGQVSGQLNRQLNGESPFPSNEATVRCMRDFVRDNYGSLGEFLVNNSSVYSYTDHPANVYEGGPSEAYKSAAEVGTTKLAMVKGAQKGGGALINVAKNATVATERHLISGVSGALLKGLGIGAESLAELAAIPMVTTGTTMNIEAARKCGCAL